jgi:type VI secretion system protein ImpA
MDQAAEEFRRFCGALAEKSGLDPPSSDLLGVIDSYRDTIKDLARDKLARAPAPAVPADMVLGQPAAAATAASPADPGAIRDRNDALERLRKIADYFREHESQSVIPYALEQVVNWGKMSLPDLLAELIPDEGPRKSVFKQVGIRPPETKK